MPFVLTRIIFFSDNRFKTDKDGSNVFDSRYKKKESVPTYDVALFNVRLGNSL